MKLIALDVGTKRIGVAHADSSVRIAIPDGVILVDGQEFAKISNLCRRYNTKWFVLGLPRNNQGEETAQSAYVRQFAVKMMRLIPDVKIRFQDESLTSVEAKARLKARRRAPATGYNKGEVDPEAAAIILQDFLDGYLSQISAEKLKPAPSDEILSKTSPQSKASLSKTGSSKTNPPEASASQSSASPSSVSNQHLSGATPVKHASADQFSAFIPPSDEEEDDDLLSASDLPGRLPDRPVHIKKKSRAGHKLLIVSIVIIVLLVLGAGGFGFWYKINLSPTFPIDSCPEVSIDDYTTAACTEVPFTVETGDTVSDIGKVLSEVTLIKSSTAFDLYMRFVHGNDTIKPGSFGLTRSMSTPEIADKLVEGDPEHNVFTFTVFPGDTVSDVKKRLQSIGYDAEQINAAFAKSYDFPMLSSRNLSTIETYGAEPLEGYIFGETFEFYKTDSAEAIIKRYLQKMQEVVDDNHLEERFKEQGLTLAEGITLASIVQKEAYERDQPGVARVFLNRLANGMTLGSDVTVSYALNLVDPGRTQYTDNSSALEVQSPYNTRKNAGLPPGPISNPGLSALLAVAEPEQNGYLYFLTGDDGMMYYSTTEEGHLQNIQNYCHELCNVGL